MLHRWTRSAWVDRSEPFVSGSGGVSSISPDGRVFPGRPSPTSSAATSPRSPCRGSSASQRPSTRTSTWSCAGAEARSTGCWTNGTRRCARWPLIASDLGLRGRRGGFVLVFGERGSVDVLGWDARRDAIVVVEVKTELTSIEATLRKHDEKIRLGPRIARDRFGRLARTVIGLLVVSDDSTSRRRAERHALVLGSAYPIRGRAAWAVAASGRSSARGLVFLSATGSGGVRSAPVVRVRKPRPSG